MHRNDFAVKEEVGRVEKQSSDVTYEGLNRQEATPRGIGVYQNNGRQ